MMSITELKMLETFSKSEHPNSVEIVSNGRVVKSWRAKDFKQYMPSFSEFMMKELESKALNRRTNAYIVRQFDRWFLYVELSGTNNIKAQALLDECGVAVGMSAVIAQNGFGVTSSDPCDAATAVWYLQAMAQTLLDRM